MPYQNIGNRIRFFVDSGLLLKSMGHITIPTHQYTDFGNGYYLGITDEDAVRAILLDPTNNLTFQNQGMYLYLPNAYKCNYCAILGHNFSNIEFYSLKLRLLSGSLSDYHNIEAISNIANWNEDWAEGGSTMFNGFSICEFVQPDAYLQDFDPDNPDDPYGQLPITWDQIGIYIQHNYYSSYPVPTFGAISFGSTYDLQSPDLTIVQDRTFDSKKIRTKGGNDLYDYKYITPPLWANGMAPWEPSLVPEGEVLPDANFPGVQTLNQKMARIGRRSWTLTFSQKLNTDIWGSHQLIGNFNRSITGDYYWYPGGETGGTTSGSVVSNPIVYDDGDKYSDGYSYNLMSDDSFYSQVLHKVQGRLPFIMCIDYPDTSYPYYSNRVDDLNPQNFAICKFDMSSFKTTQVSDSIVKIKIKIREVW